MTTEAAVPAVSSHLFVYGTLLTGAVGSKGRAQRERLRRTARSLGAATAPGRLYDLGQYPGFVPALAGECVVHGEVLALAAPFERTLRWLDDYEGIVPGDHPHNEYERRLIDTVLGDGEVVRAWAYVYLPAPRPQSLIPGGRWLERRAGS